MILPLFRTNQAYASLLLFFYALALQTPAFFFPVAEVPTTDLTYFGGWLTEAVMGNRWAALLTPPLLVALAGILANQYADRYRLSRTVSQFPGLLLVLLWGLCPAFHAFSPHQLCFSFLLLAAGNLGSTYKGQSPEVARFNAGFWLGAASLLEPTYLLFVPACIVGISIFRTADLRTITQLLVGVAIAYFLAVTYAYFQGDLYAFYLGQLAGFGWLQVLTGADNYALIGAALLALPLLVVLATATRSRILLTIEGAKNVSFVYWLLLFTPLVGGVAGAMHVADAQLLAPVLGILTGLWLVRQPDAQAEFYHLLFFVAALTLYTVSLAT